MLLYGSAEPSTAVGRCNAAAYRRRSNGAGFSVARGGFYSQGEQDHCRLPRGWRVVVWRVWRRRLVLAQMMGPRAGQPGAALMPK